MGFPCAIHYNTSRFAFAGVLERTKNLAREKYPGTINYRTLEELLDDEEVELVVVNTPSITHYEFAKRCLEAGKHVIVEKPFTATSQEARELISIAANKNLKLSVYHNRRYDSDYRTVKKILDEGWIGDLVDVEIRYDRYVPGLSHKQHKEPPPLPLAVYTIWAPILSTRPFNYLAYLDRYTPIFVLTGKDPW